MFYDKLYVKGVPSFCDGVQPAGYSSHVPWQWPFSRHRQNIVETAMTTSYRAKTNSPTKCQTCTETPSPALIF